MSQKIVRSTSTVAGFTFLSRILGFVRDIIFASVFGAGGVFDAFVIAFKLPNFLRRLFGEGAFSQAFIPILAEQRAQQSPAEVQSFVDRVAGTLGISVLIVVLVAEIAVPLLTMIFAPGFVHDPARFALTEHLLHIMFPYLLLIVLTAFAGAILNTCGLFAAPAFTPVLLNVSFIVVALWWAPHASSPIATIAWGVIFGGLAQLLIQIPFLKRVHLLPRFKIDFRDPSIVRVMKRMLPALFGVSVAQISLLIDNMFASFLPASSISWLYYSDRLIYFPLGIIGVAIATVVMPYLSRNYSEKEESVFSRTLDWALRTTLLIGFPAAVGLFVLSGPVLSTLLHYGKFSNFDVVMTAKSLSAFAVGLPAFMSIKILASAFYARQNVKTPVKIAAAAMVMNLIFNALLIFPLKHAGLALSTSIAAILNAMLLWIFLIKHGIFQPSLGWRKVIFQLIIANGGMGVLVAILAGTLTPWLAWPVMTRVVHLVLIVLAGLLFYVGLLWMMGLRLRHLRSPS